MFTIMVGSNKSKILLCIAWPVGPVVASEAVGI